MYDTLLRPESKVVQVVFPIFFDPKKRIFFSGLFSPVFAPRLKESEIFYFPLISRKRLGFPHRNFLGCILYTAQFTPVWSCSQQ